MSNFIHPTAIIGDNVYMGTGNYIGPYCFIDNCVIGDNNRFEAYCSIGTRPEHRTIEACIPVIIGDNNTFREFITINCGTERHTQIGSNVWMLAKAHIGHDAIIGDNVTLSCFSCVGGHCEIWDYANLGLHSVVHQNVIVPPGVMLGMGAVIAKKTPLKHFTKLVGVPAKQIGYNIVLMDKLGDNKVNELIKKYEQS